jgi:hypothetical protein
MCEDTIQAQIKVNDKLFMGEDFRQVTGRLDQLWLATRITRAEADEILCHVLGAIRHACVMSALDSRILNGIYNTMDLTIKKNE